MIGRLWFACGLSVCLTAPLPALAQRSRQAETDFGAPVPAQGAGQEPNLAAVAQQIMDLTNAFRHEQGRPPLAFNSRLTSAAAYFAHYMATKEKFAHTADGHEPWDRVRLAGYDDCIVAENIAYEFNSAGFTTAELANSLVRGWENSPEHRRNLLDPDIVDIGVGVAQDPKTSRYYAVQDFGRPKSLAVRFTLVNQTAGEISYQVGGKDFKIDPNYSMTHERCRPASVTLKLKAAGNRTHDETLTPRSGQVLTIRQNPAGEQTLAAENSPGG